ncbi:MAG: restriction endonuclease [Clostridia bacterium]|nr:restriction endonuclease [Clostridia bacterium]
MSNIYNRNKEELEKNACKWWPNSLVELESASSIVPVLIKTQDQFISILTLANSKDSDSIFNVMIAAKFPANMFLKHLMVLTDFGSEPLQRINRDFSNYFPDNKLVYSIDGTEQIYQFSTLPVSGTLNNKKMHTDIDGIITVQDLTPFYKDLITLLLFGSNASEEKIANIFSKCLVGNMMGQHEELNNFIKQRYIFVSRITGGAQANGLGNSAQVYAEKYLKQKLGTEYTIKSNGHIPGVTQNNRTETTFDLSVEHNNRYVGIEISFQVTTNSTIERKAGQAQARKEAVEKTGNYIAYIIDGAGNFQRESALTTICQYSHCSVAYTDSEFDVLVNFIKEKIG